MSSHASRKPVAASAILVLLLGVIVSIIPTGSPQVGTGWTEALVYDEALSAGSSPFPVATIDVNAIQFSDGHGALATACGQVSGCDNSGELTIFRCFEFSCALTATFVSNVPSYGGHNIGVVRGSLNGAVCFQDTGTTLRFSRTANAGASWSASSIINGTGGSWCSIQGISSTSWVVAHVGSGTDVVFTATTDSGSSWSAPVQVDDLGAPEYVHVAVKSATEYLVQYVSDASTHRSCRTTDSGAAWSCVTIGTGVLVIDMDYSPSDDVYYAASKSTTNTFWFSTDNGAWDGVSLGASIDRSAVAVEQNDLGTYLFAKTETTFEGGFHVYRLMTAESTDDGLTWSSFSDAYTVTAGDSGTFPRNGVAVASGGGDTIVGYRFTSHVGGGGGSSSARFRVVAREDTSASAFSAGAFVDVTTLVGVDIDFIGNNVITRRLAGAATSIATYDATTLTPVADALTTCNQVDSVFAHPELVAYVDCDAGDPDFLRIRDINLVEPDLSPNCVDSLGGVYCSPNWQFTDGASTFEDNDDFFHLADIQTFPIDLSNNRNQNQAANPAESYAAWAYTTGSGKVGVAMFTASVDSLAQEEVRRNQASVAYSSTAADDMCAWLFDGDEYVGAVKVANPPRIWRTDFSLVNEESVDELQGTMNHVVSYAGSASQAFGIACAGNRTAVVRSAGGVDSVVLLNAFTGVILDTLVLEGGARTRGVAMSGDASFIAFGDGLTGRVANITGGAISLVASFDLPSDWSTASKTEAFMDFKGGTAWFVTSTNMSRYDVSTVTCVSDCAVADADLPTPPTAVGEDTGLFAGAGTSIGGAFGVGSFGGNLFLGALLMGLVAYGAGTGYGNVEGTRTGARALRINGVAAMIGAILGFLLAWGFGFFTAGVVFAVIVLAALVAFLVLRRG